MIHKQNTTYKSARLSRDFTKYKKLRNQVTVNLRKAKQKLFLSLDPAKPKQFLKALSMGVSVIPLLTHEGVTADSYVGKGN